MYYFTSDEHYWHKNIIKYCNRPFSSVEEMNNTLIENHNRIVKKNDTTIHAGDFSFKKEAKTQDIIRQLNGNHIFLKGSHDKWLKEKGLFLWENRIENQYVVVCHYALRTWPCEHYGSWQLHGHSHGELTSIKNQYDVGVDCNNFYPVSFDQLKEYFK